jgi:phosphohistidine phosphatase SixA
MLTTENGQPFVILVRHASRESFWDKSENEHPMANWTRRTTATIPGKSDFETKGFPLTYAVAGRLCDELENRNAFIVALVHSKHEVAQQTADVYRRVFNNRKRFKDQVKVDCCGDLTPEAPITADKVIGQTERIVRQLKAVNTDQANSESTREAYVLVGHQPQLTQIARGLLNNRSLPGDALPIGSSEAACIELGRKPRLLWVLTEKPAELLAELKDKIKSKYDVAKFFLGAFIVNTGLILNAGIWGQPELWEAAPIAKFFAYAAIIVAIVSLIFTAFTLFSYDALMMPPSFWSEPSADRKGSWWRKLLGSDGKPPKWSVSRPPSQAHVILFYEMMHVWSAFFIPAVSCALVAIGSLVLALICRVEDCLPFTVYVPSLPSWVFFILVAVIGGLCFGFYWWQRPKLGTED